MAKKFTSYQEALEYVNTLPINTVIEGYARSLVEQEKTQPIKLTETQFREHFRLIGTTSTGEAERRGRKPKNA